MNKPVLLLLFIFLIILIFFVKNGSKISNDQSTSTKKVHFIDISGTKIEVELAQNPQEWAMGLGGRNFILDNQGMIFLFSKKDYYRFWMKNMKFPLDFIWIDEDRIVDITQNVSYLNQEEIYQPKFPSDKVLEVKAGFVKKYKIKIGDQVLWL